MEKLRKKLTTDLQITVHTVLSMSPSILHSAHVTKTKMNLENDSGEWLCCLSVCNFLRKAVAAKVVLIGVLDVIDPGELLVCLSIGTESLAAALDMHCRSFVTGIQDTPGHFCKRPFMCDYLFIHEAPRLQMPRWNATISHTQ